MTSITSPGTAPSIAIGPVRIWPGIVRSHWLWTSRSSGGISKRESVGITSGAPLSVSTVTSSPLLIVSAGFSFASK
ncbi:hypothetical protein D3C87_1905820 [compost metagenome]